MRNSDITLDTLSILSLDGQLPEGEEIKVSPDIGPTVSSNYFFLLLIYL